MKTLLSQRCVTIFSVGLYIFHTIATMVVMFKLAFVLIHQQLCNFVFTVRHFLFNPVNLLIVFLF